MILFLTLIYVAVLLLLVKLRLVPWNLWTKLSPAIWMILLLIVLFLPLQFYAPSGPALVFQPTVQIVPSVSGPVTDIHVTANQRVQPGDRLFTIDPVQYEAAVDRLKADLQLAEIRLSQSTELLERGSGRQIDVDRDQKQVDSLKAQLRAAQWDLEQTEVRAPGSGWMANVDALQVGARVVSFPVQQAMALVQDQRVIALQIHQIFLRHIEEGQPVEITFKMLPGQVFTGTVEHLIRGVAQGQVTPTGNLLAPRDATPMPFPIRIRLDDPEVAATLPAGAVGSGAIYTGPMGAIYVIRRVMIWMDAWMNFVLPL
jgi:multidrug resistance efflux pump